MVDVLSVYLLSDTALAKVMPWKMRNPPEFHKIRSCNFRFQDGCVGSIKNCQRAGKDQQPIEGFNDMFGLYLSFPPPLSIVDARRLWT